MKKLKWGMIGGREGSQIGPTHRLGAQTDGRFEFVAGALDHHAEEGRAHARHLGIAPDRAYGDWREMLAGKQPHNDRIDLSPWPPRTRPILRSPKPFWRRVFIGCAKSR